MDLYNFHRQINSKICNQIKKITPIETPELKQYKTKIIPEFKTYEVSSWNTLINVCHQKQIILVGDHHLAPQSQRSFLRILRNFNNPDFEIALEFFHHDETKLLEKYLNNSISIEELDYRIRQKNNRLCSVLQYKDILEYAKKNKIPIQGVDYPNKNLKTRDQKIADLLVKKSKTQLCLVGNYHLASSHLPGVLIQKFPQITFLKIYQNFEKLWWKESRSGNPHEVYRLRSDSYCIQSIPPWVINLHYLDYLYEHEESLEDLTYLKGILKTFSELLDLQSLSIDDYEYFVFNLQTQDPYPAKAMEHFLHSSVYLNRHQCFIPSLGLNHLSDAAAKMIFKKLKNYKSNQKEVESFSFFMSLLINPRRKPPAQNKHWIDKSKLEGYKLYHEYISSKQSIKKFIMENF